MQNTEILNKILEHYIICALWTEEDNLKTDYDNLVFGYDEDDDELEKIIKLSSNLKKKEFEKFTKEDIENDSLIKAYSDIKKFINLVGDDIIDEILKEVGPEQIGHDLWLSRNGHGAGFFDRGYDYEIEKKLMKAAKDLGGVDLYMTDDNKLSFSNEHIWENQKNMKIIVNEEDLIYIEESIMNGEVLREDLRRWFKEKWVDVSKKVGGKHPPCGRKDANGKSYPKCRPSKKVSKETPKVASSYSKKEKKLMTTQKRRAEKKEPKIGKGNKPTIAKFDEEKVKQIVCKCGWKWDLKDGGKDPYICHKCGHDNSKKTIISITEKQFQKLIESYKFKKRK